MIKTGLMALGLMVALAAGCGGPVDGSADGSSDQTADAAMLAGTWLLEADNGAMQCWEFGDTGDPVYASNDGRVALSHDLFYSGQAVYLDHGLGFFTAYFHLSERLVSDGQWVEKGQLIGRVGATGRVTGPHLHWSAFLRGQHLDPLSLLEPGFARESERLFLAPAGLAVAP